MFMLDKKIRKSLDEAVNALKNEWKFKEDFPAKERLLDRLKNYLTFYWQEQCDKKTRLGMHSNPMS